jgi:hypothetical protein
VSLSVRIASGIALFFILKSIDFAWVDYADGESVLEPICPARVLWHGKWKEVEVVLSNDEEPAIGTLLLKGSKVNMSFVKNKLTIRKPETNRRRKRCYYPVWQKHKGV